MKAKELFFNLKLTCNACGIENKEGLFCKDCKDKLPYNNVFCERCGRSTINKEKACMSCQGQELHFEKARSAFKYLEPISVMIQRLKYRGKRYYSRIFSIILAYYLLTDFADTDVLINVPMHKKDKFIRGYNQTEYLARELSKITGVNYKNNVFKKEIRTPRQATLNKEERKKNLKNAYKILDKNAIKGKVVTIVDDIITTGSTVETLAEKLKKAKAKKVYVLTIASVGEREAFERVYKKNFIDLLKKLFFFDKIFQKRYRHNQKNIVK